MKKNVHPKYYPNAKISCACGNVIETGSTVSEMKVEICGACHPFYSGKKKLLDATGRVERFKQITEKFKQKKATLTEKKSRSKKPKAETKKVVSKKKKKK